MIKKTINFVDYNGQELSEDFYFNLNKVEIVELLTASGNEGYTEDFVHFLINEKDFEKIVSMIKDVILKAYGTKSADGKRFIKSKEATEAFSQTEAYVELYMELISNEAAAAIFVNGIVPQDKKEIPSS